MASIVKRKNKTEGNVLAVQVVVNGDQRITITLGKMERRDALVIGRHIERLKLLSSGCALQSDTLAWLDSIRGSELEKRLVEKGLLQRTDAPCIPIGKFIERFIAERPYVKPATRITYGYIERNLTACFGSKKALNSFTPADGDKFRGWLHETEKLAPNTIGRRIGLARQVFDAARRAKLVTENPFSHLKATVRGNPKKFHYVTREEYVKLMKSAPDATWRCIIALARIGGIRIPSEAFSLSWNDVDWEQKRIRITSPKTEAHEGHAERVLPMFPELEVALRELFDETEDGAIHVINHYRDPRQNLRTHFTRLIKRAGLKPWPKLFVNMRASRATELRNEFPEHVCTAWLGHSAKVASEFYLRVRDEDFERAIRAADSLSPVGANDEITGEIAQSEKNKTAFCAKERGSAPNIDKRRNKGWARPDSNREPRDYESLALTN